MTEEQKALFEEMNKRINSLMEEAETGDRISNAYVLMQACETRNCLLRLVRSMNKEKTEENENAEEMEVRLKIGANLMEIVGLLLEQPIDSFASRKFNITTDSGKQVTFHISVTASKEMHDAMMKGAVNTGRIDQTVEITSAIDGPTGKGWN